MFNSIKTVLNASFISQQTRIIFHVPNSMSQCLETVYELRGSLANHLQGVVDLNC